LFSILFSSSFASFLTIDFCLFLGVGESNKSCSSSESIVALTISSGKINGRISSINPLPATMFSSIFFTVSGK